MLPPGQSSDCFVFVPFVLQAVRPGCWQGCLAAADDSVLPQRTQGGPCSCSATLQCMCVYTRVRTLQQQVTRHFPKECNVCTAAAAHNICGHKHVYACASLLGLCVTLWQQQQCNRQPRKQLQQTPQQQQQQCACLWCAASTCTAPFTAGTALALRASGLHAAVWL
jgi:hypothetical protein